MSTIYLKTDSAWLASNGWNTSSDGTGTNVTLAGTSADYQYDCDLNGHSISLTSNQTIYANSITDSVGGGTLIVTSNGTATINAMLRNVIDDNNGACLLVVNRGQSVIVNGSPGNPAIRNDGNATSDGSITIAVYMDGTTGSTSLGAHALLTVNAGNGQKALQNFGTCASTNAGASACIFVGIAFAGNDAFLVVNGDSENVGNYGAIVINAQATIQFNGDVSNGSPDDPTIATGGGCISEIADPGSTNISSMVYVTGTMKNYAAGGNGILSNQNIAVGDLRFHCFDINAWHNYDGNPDAISPGLNETVVARNYPQFPAPPVPPPGSPSVDLTGYWNALPGQTQNVSYTSVATNTTSTTFTLSTVIQTPEQRREKLDSWGKYVQRAKTVKIPSEVWAAVAGSLYPKPRDTMVLSGITWQVSTDTDIQYSNGLYRLMVNYFEPQFDIDDVVSFLNPSVSGSSSTGDRQVTFIPAATGIHCGIEPIRQEVSEDHFGAKTSPEYFDIFLSRDISVANDPSIVVAGAVVQDQNGVQYDVLEVNSRERLDLETHLVCVKKL